MSTTNNVILANVVPSSTSNVFNVVWKLTRAMKKAGWKYIASGDGSTKDSTGNPKADRWNASPGTTVGTTSNAGATGSGVVIGTPARGRATVSGLSGIVVTDKGRFLVLSGFSTSANNNVHQIEEIVSGTSVKIDARTFAVAAESPSSCTWSIQDPTGDTSNPSGLSNSTGWWCARGPSTLKVPIAALPTVGGTGLTFIRGENIIGSQTGFEGEIEGYVYDGAGSGYLVVAPRLRGTGSGVYGVGTSSPDTFTGSLSGASVAQNGTALEFRHEVVVYKDSNQIKGSIWHGTFETVGDAATMFSYLAVNAAGCDASVAPGSGGTGNSFPAKGYVGFGYDVSPLHLYWACTNVANTTSNCQIMCRDLIEEQNYSADGNWILALGNTNVAGGVHQGHAFLRMDNTEEGDLDPYCSYHTPMGGYSLYGQSRTAPSWNNNTADIKNGFVYSAGASSTGLVHSRGWRALGTAVENFTDFEFAVTYLLSTAAVAMANASSDAEKVASAPVTTRMREPIWVVANLANGKVRKGTCRWLYMVGGGNGCDTYDNKVWIQLSPSVGAFVAGPWDGVTSPTIS